MNSHLSSLSSSSSSPQSLSSSGSYSSGWEANCTPYRGLRPAKVVTNQDMPFSLKMLSRSPKEILEKKAAMEEEKKAEIEEGGKAEEDETFIDEKVVEGEMQVKLFYLDMIHRLREGGSVCQSGEVTTTLVLRIKDMENKIEQANRLIKLGEEQQKMIMWKVVEASQELVNLKMDQVSSKEVQARTVSICQARLVSCQTQLADAQARLHIPPVPGVTGQATSCTQFSNLFCLSGQLSQLCRGEQGSKWVVDRLVEGQQQERSLVRSELNLPQDLTKHLTSTNCRTVILTLAEVDSQARIELLRQTKIEIDTILGMEGGQEFVEKLVKGE